MSDNDKPSDAEEIISEFQKKKAELEKPAQTQLDSSPPEPELSAPPPEPKSEPEAKDEDGASRVRNVIFVGIKPIMTYVTATLTQLSSEPTVTIKARGKRITQAVDVSQMIVKRMNTVGYKVSAVRIASDSLTSQDGKQRNVSTIEIDITKS